MVLRVSLEIIISTEIKKSNFFKQNLLPFFNGFRKLKRKDRKGSDKV